MENNTSENQNANLVKAILVAGLIVGTLDIMAASVQTMINGRDPLNMWKFIASGVFGKKALTGGLMYSFLGLFFHYCIATIWSTIFFLAYPRISALSENRVLTGLAYGLFVWLGMSQIVLPLSNVPPLSFKLAGAIKAILILMGAIGLPLSFLASRFYSTHSVAR
ncbi:MAG: hypothetical protein L0Y35_05250 [Flammeovirgaceae bacterium]|nr:hypothetical protein [Flammeovirgaceae bacterium]